MGSQQFCLRWNNHQMNMLNVFDQLLHNGDFVDVTLSCSGGAIKAHKMVLSACSPYFQELFRDNPCKHPIVILKDMKMLELRSIVDFMYKGEINVSQDQLPTLLKTAESLKVKGLAEVSSSGSGSGSSADQQTANSSSPARDDGSLVPTSNGTGGVQRFAGGEGSAQSDGRMSPHPKRKRHRPARRQSNDDSNNEDAEEKNDVSKDGSKSTMLKSEPLEVNEPQIELLMDDEQFPRLDASINDQERNANDVRDGNSRLSQSDIMEMSQPSTSGAHGASGGRGGGNKRNGKMALAAAKRKKNQALRGGGEEAAAASSGTQAAAVPGGARKESSVWSYYSCNNDSKIVECLLCQRIFKKPGNTTNLFDHLKRRHFGHWQKLEGSEGEGTPSSPPRYKRSTRPRSIYARHYKANLRGLPREVRKSVGNNNSNNNNNNGSNNEDDNGTNGSASPLDESPELGDDGGVAAQTLQAAQGLAATAARLSIPF